MRKEWERAEVGTDYMMSDPILKKWLYNHKRFLYWWEFFGIEMTKSTRNLKGGNQ